MTSEYRFAPALLVRSLGALLAVVGLLLSTVVALVAFAGLPVLVLTVSVVVAVVVVVVGGLLASRRTTLVRFDEAGYQVRLLRGAGVKQARWREVEDAVTAHVAGQDCVVLRLKDGRTTTIPVSVLDADPGALLRDLTAHLDRGHGYRRLR